MRREGLRFDSIFKYVLSYIMKKRAALECRKTPLLSKFPSSTAQCIALRNFVDMTLNN